MPIRKRNPEPYKIYFRISSLWETVEENATILNVTGEILPRYSLGLPEEEDTSLKKNLLKAFKANKDYIINKVGIIVRDLAVEVMDLSEKPKRAEKLKELKFNLIDISDAYNDEYYMLELTIKYKPLMKPVFEEDFYHSGIIFQEELKSNTIEAGVKPVLSNLRLLKGGSKNARHIGRSKKSSA